VSGAKPADRAPKTIRVLKAALQEGRAEVAPSDDTASTRELVTCGRPSPEHRLLIADPRTGAVMPEGAIGEIWLSGPSVAEGYWRNPEETASVFSARSPSVEGGEFLRTGDLGFFIGGELVVTGRSKDLVIIRGKNHFPQDLEASAESAHPGIVPGGVAAFAVEERGEECLALAAELRTSSQAPEGFQSIEERIREAVARDHDVTVHAVALLSKRTLPKTSSGKLQRGVCRDRFTDGTLPCLHCGRLEAPERGGRGESGRGGEPEHTFTEAEIREWLVRELARRVGMGPDEIDPGKSFDAYGLDSHAAVEMLEDVELWLGYAVDSAMFYKYPTIDLLVGYLMEAHAGDEPPSSPSKAGLRRKAD
jgi:phthiocerol/phenolphthiocerol synthesis type-I polyketide synthase C